MGKISDLLKKIENQRQGKKDDKSAQAGSAANNNEPVVQPKPKVFASLNANTVVANDKASGVDERVIMYSDSDSPIAEQYRGLRTHIKSYFAQAKASHKASTIKPFNGPKIFTVTSSLAGEGKSLTCVNLAIALAKDIDAKVLLIDCDLRNGTIHKLLNLAEKPGVTEMLADNLEYSAAVQPTPIKNLFVIPRGKICSHPSELFGSQRSRFIIEQLRSEDLGYVIIDTPPLFPFTDANVISANTDGAMLVVQAYRTKAQVVKKAKELFDRARVNFMGFVLTQTEYYIQDMYGYYNYYSYQHNKKEDKKN